MEKKESVRIRQQSLRQDRDSVFAQPVKPSESTATRDFETIAQRWFDLADDERDDLKCEGAPDWTGLACAPDSGAPPERLLGILAACAIEGCDVHFISEAETILRHLAKDDPIPSAFQWARQYLAASGPDVVAVLVFESRNQLLCLDGTLRQPR